MNCIRTSRAALLLGTLSIVNLCCSDNDGKKTPAAQGTRPAVAAQPGQRTLSATLVSDLPSGTQILLRVSGLKLATGDGKATQVLPVTQDLDLRSNPEGACVRSPLIKAHGLERNDFTSLVLQLQKEGHTATLAAGVGPQPLSLPRQLIDHGIPVPVLGELCGASTGDLQITFRASGSVLRKAGPGGLVLHPQMWATRLGGCVSLEGKVTDTQDHPLQHHPVTAQVAADKDKKSAAGTAAGTTVLGYTVTDGQGNYRLDALPRTAAKTCHVVTLPFPHEHGCYGLDASPGQSFSAKGDASKHTFNPKVSYQARTGRLDGTIQSRLPEDAHFEVDILQVWRPQTAPPGPAGAALPVPTGTAPPGPAGPPPAAGAGFTFQVASLRPDLVQGEAPSSFGLDLPPGQYLVRLRKATLGDHGAFTRATLGTEQTCDVTAGGRAQVTFPAR
jgi:hypothetical protein